MKKILAVLLSAVMVLAVAGCSGSSTPSTKTGVGISTGWNSVAEATADANGTIQADVTVCAVTLDKDGKIVSISWDAVQPKGTFDATGKVTFDQAAAVQTKKELKENYNMKGVSPIGKEWYEQIAALEEYAVGKTPAEVTGMKVTEGGAPDVEELKSSCTINCVGIFEALTKAAANAK